jgi:putative transposase
MHLPKHWKQSVRTAVLHAISLGHYAIAQARGQAVDSDERRREVDIERLRAEIALLHEELRIKEARMERVPAHRRPHYTSFERMAILELKAARGWSLAKTAAAFFVTTATVREWMRRLDEPGPKPLVRLGGPVNKFPEFVAYIVQRLKTLCPTLGKRRIAQTLARAGLHLSATTVTRMLKTTPQRAPGKGPATLRGVRARRINQIWHVDLTTIPITGGFWVPWLPNALPPCWPFCWWIALVIDQFSRRVMGAAMFRKQPTSEQVRALIGRIIRQTGAKPCHLICDRGRQFDCHGFRRWCGRRRIQVRYGAVGRQGSIAVVERLIRTFKEALRLLILIPLRREALRKELSLIVAWYNAHRPHAALGGRTPNEVYCKHFPAHRRPRYEPRAKWPKGSPCARPWALVRGRPGARLELKLAFHGGRKHLPIVTLKRVA